MSNVNEIINAYTLGEKTLDETNAALKEAKSNLHLNPDRNKITDEELKATTVGNTPSEVNGWGLMDHGFGVLEKVQIVDGKTVNVDIGAELAFVYIGGKMYRLEGKELK